MAQIPNPNYTSINTNTILKKLLEEQNMKRRNRMLVRAPGVAKGGPKPGLPLGGPKPGLGMTSPQLLIKPEAKGMMTRQANPTDLGALRRLTMPKGMGRAHGVGAGAALVALLTLLEEGYNWYNQEDAGAHSAEEALKEITMQLSTEGGKGETTTVSPDIRSLEDRLLYQEGGQVPNNEDFNLVDFYNSLEQNYKQSPEGEVVEAGGEDILDYIMRVAPGIAEGGLGLAGQGVNSLAEFLTKPAGFQGSHELLSTQERELLLNNAHGQIDELIGQNDVVNTLSDYLSEEFGGVQSIPSRLMPR